MKMPDIPEIPGLSRDQALTLMNCRTLGQYTSMIDDYQAGKCPFCDPLDKKNKVVMRNSAWRMWQNPFPLKHTKLHFVVAHKQHFDFGQWADPSMDLYELGDLLQGVQRHFEFAGGALAMRFGSPEFNAGSVLHLHVNIIVPDGTGAVQVTLAKEPEKVAETIARMHAFERLRSRIITAGELTDEEKRLVAGRLE